MSYLRKVTDEKDEYKQLFVGKEIQTLKQWQTNVNYTDFESGIFISFSLLDRLKIKILWICTGSPTF